MHTISMSVMQTQISNVNGLRGPVRVALQIAVDTSADLPDEADFGVWVNTALNAADRDLPAGACVTIRIVGIEESSKLNESFRFIQKPTNVLAFPAGDQPLLMGEDEEHELGDLVICGEVVVREAEQQRKSLRDHFAHMAVHGALHLVGYDHENDAEAGAMESLETRVLASLEVSDPYAER